MSSTVGGTASGGATDRTNVTGMTLAGILALGLILRLLFINADGFHNDVSAFESWALTLSEHPIGEFYAKAGFADYPPGYFLVLWVVGHLYKLLHIADPAYAVLKIMIKLPAIAMDLAVTWLIFTVVRRFASPGWALFSAGFFALNPAAIYISAYWGQVDSVASGLALAGLLALIVAPARGPAGERIAVVLGWLALAFSLLIKPQAALLVPLFIAYAFATRDGAERKRRLIATGLGVLAAGAFTYAIVTLFYGPHGPLEALFWLLLRYMYGSTVYQYNTINAFNLYAVFRPFWQPDSAPISLGSLGLGAMYVWGIVLVLAASVLLIARFLQKRDQTAFLECAMLLTFAFFILSTRMHERYVYNAFMLSMPLMFVGRRYVYTAAILSLTLLVNLAYSLAYQTVLEQHTPGVDAANMWPLITHPLSMLNVIVFFVLGYMYLGGKIDGLELTSAPPSAEGRLAGLRAKARTWFAPRQGLTAFTRADYVVASLFALVSFVLCVMWYYMPGEKIFDEIYYARSGEEYLKHIEQFEWTHPPVTKLLITLSILFFGGIAHGDWSGGWRFLNVVIGAGMVYLIYAFARRLTGSTLFASIAAAMLTFDGFHFVQSRIATPEITVAFLSLATLYAFYRFWLAAQVRLERVVPTRFGTPFYLVMGIGTLVAIALSYVVNAFGSTPATITSRLVAFGYFELGVFLVARLILPAYLKATSTTTSYADGTRVRGEGASLAVYAPDGGELTGAKKSAVVPGELSRALKGELVLEDQGLRIAYARDGAMRYETPEGTATFEPAGVMRSGSEVLRASDAGLWLIVLAICGALLAASKWNGLFDFFVVWMLSLAVLAQRFIRRPALYGNPFGFSVEVVVAAMLFVSGTVYALSYIPYYAFGHNFVDMIGLQHQMYQYHHDLKASHPYQSTWWQWPLLERPISYYYHDFRTGAATSNGNACCVSEILALPNPLIWWLGLASIPFVAFLAWKERNKGYALIAIAYVIQWLPWIGSPRIAFEYHFFPNLALIVLANTVLLQRIWSRPNYGKYAVGGFLLASFAAFWFFYPILAGVHITYNDWQARMWSMIIGNGFNWI